MLLKALKMIFKKESLDVLIFLLALHIGIIFGSWWLIKDGFNTPPCKVCGRARTEAVETLYKYKTQNNMPYMKEKKVYYCDRHINDAPRIVNRLHSEEDTVKKRFRLTSILSSIILFLVVFSVAVLEIDFNYLLLYPLIHSIYLLIFGVTSNITITTMFVLMFLAPFGIFYLWYKNTTSRLY